jgi:cell shape-determining protein MreC
MLLLGLIIGFCAGVGLTTFGYLRLTERFDECEARLRKQADLLNEAMSEVGRLASENHHLRHLKGKR